MGSVRFTTFLVKVASRCNIACDYCYVYEHNDQGWRDQPRLMSADTEVRLVDRLGEYVAAERLTRILVIFHGGEPLLAGADRLAGLADAIRARLPGVDVDFSVQTNGTLLDDRSVEVLHEAAIGVSLSLDGPAEVNDLHRLTPRGTTTFPAVMNALRRLRQHPASFTGVIAVIDPTVPPEDLLGFFADLDLPALDLLLPDANHTWPPAGRDERPRPVHGLAAARVRRMVRPVSNDAGADIRFASGSRSRRGRRGYRRFRTRRRESAVH